MGVLNKIVRVLWTPTQAIEKAKRPQSFDDVDSDTYTREHGVDYKTNRGTLEDYMQTYEVSVWVYICVNKIMSSIAQVPLKVWKRKKGAKRGEWKDLSTDDPNHPLVKLIQNPNPYMTEYEFKQGIVGCLELGGNSYIEIVSKGKTPDELYLLLPYKTKVVPDAQKYIRGYVYEVGTSVISYKPEEVSHIRYFHPRSQYYGLSPIQASEMSIITDLNAAEYNKNFFKNSAVPDGILYTDQELNDDAYKRLQREWQSAHQGVKKSHRVAIAEQGLKWQATMITAKDMEFINSRKLSREEIMGIYGVPPVIAGIMEYASYANSNEQKRQYWEHTLDPKLKIIQERLNLDIASKFEDPDLYIEFDLSLVQAIRENRESEARVDSAYVDRGIKRINEVRREKGLDPVPWGDEWHPPNAGGLAVSQVTPKPQGKPGSAGDVSGGDQGAQLGPGPKNEGTFSQQNQPTKFPSEDGLGKFEIPDIMEPGNISEPGGVSEVCPFPLSEINAAPDQLTKDWMIWSNEALKEEDVWAAEIEGFLKGLAKESSDKLAALAVDEKGVLAENPKQEPFFDRNVAIRVLADTGMKLMRHTAKQFGDRAIKEALNAKPANQ